MFHWNQQCSPSTISTLVLHHTAVFLLLTHYGGQAALIDSSEQIVAMIGDDVILPCHLEPSADLVDETVEWARLDLNPRYVHVRRDGVEIFLNQNPSFMGRTSLSLEKLFGGDMSLTISEVKLSDEGTYRCLVPDRGSTDVELIIGAVSSPVITIEDITTKTAALQCEAKGWSPEPELLWLDNKGNNLTAERTRPEKDAGGLYRTSSRVSVETKKEQVFTCRVQQKNIHQTREAHVHIQGHACVPPSFCAACVAMVISVVVLLLSVVSVGFIVLWRRRQKKINDDEDLYSTVEEGAEEKKKLDEERTSLNDEDDKSYQDDEEDNDLSRLISILEEQREDLRKSKTKLKSKVDKARRDLVENQRLDPDNSESKNDQEAREGWLKMKVRLEEKLKTHSDSQSLAEERHKKATDLISKLTDRKKKPENPTEREVTITEKSHYDWNWLKPKKKNPEGESEKNT